MNEFELELERAKAGGGQGLLQLARKAPPDLHRKILLAVLEVKDQRSQIALSLRLARYFVPPLQAEALSQSIRLAQTYSIQGNAIQSDAPRILVEALQGVNPPYPVQKYICQEALKLAHEIMKNHPTEYKWARAMIDLGLVNDPNLALDIKEMLVVNALSAVRNLKDAGERASQLMGLVKHLPADETKKQVMQEAFQACMTIPNISRRYEKLNGLPYSLPFDLKRELLNMASLLGDISKRAEALGGLARFMPALLRSRAMDIATELAIQIPDRPTRIDLLSRLVVSLSNTQLSELIKHARTIKDPEDRSITLSSLSRHLSGDLQAGLTKEALDLAWEIKDATSKKNAMSNIAVNMLVILRGDLDTLVQGSFGVEMRETAWKSINWSWRNTLLQQELISYMYALYKHIPAPQGQVGILSMISLRLLGRERLDILQEAVITARKIEDVWLRARVLAALVWYYTDRDRTQKASLLEESMKLVREIEIRKLHMDLKRSLLTKDFKLNAYTEIIVSALQLLESEPLDPQGLYFVDVAIGVTEQLEPQKLRPALVKVLNAAESIQNDWMKARAFVGLVKYFPELKGQTLSKIILVKNEADRAGCFRTLANNLSEKSRKDVLQVALKDINQIQEKQVRLLAMGELLEAFSGRERDSLALTLLRDISTLDEWEQMHLFGRIFEYFPSSSHSEALKIMVAIKNDEHRCNIFQQTIKYYSKADQRKIATLVSDVDEHKLRIATQSEIVNHIDDELKIELAQKAHNSALNLPDVLQQALALQIMVEKLPYEMRTGPAGDALVVLRNISDPISRLTILESLEKNSPSEFQTEILQEISTIKNQLRK